MKSCHLVAILLRIAVDTSICLAQTVIGAFVIDADGLGGRQDTKSDPFVTHTHLYHGLGGADTHVDYFVFDIKILTESVISLDSLDARIQSETLLILFQHKHSPIVVLLQRAFLAHTLVSPISLMTI